MSIRNMLHFETPKEGGFRTTLRGTIAPICGLLERLDAGTTVWTDNPGGPGHVTPQNLSNRTLLETFFGMLNA